MSNIEVKPVVCDYGVYENNKLTIPIFNVRSNAELVADIVKEDLNNQKYINCKDDIKTFEPKELNGRTLKIMITENEGITLIAGQDIETRKIYLISQQYKSNRQ